MKLKKDAPRTIGRCAGCHKARPVRLVAMPNPNRPTSTVSLLCRDCEIKAEAAALVATQKAHSAMNRAERRAIQRQAMPRLRLR